MSRKERAELDIEATHDTIKDTWHSGRKDNIMMKRNIVKQLKYHKYIGYYQDELCAEQSYEEQSADMTRKGRAKLDTGTNNATVKYSCHIERKDRHMLKSQADNKCKYHKCIMVNQEELCTEQSNENIDNLAVFKKDNRYKRKSLSKLEALRQNNNEDMFRRTKDNLQNYYTLMVQTTNSNGENQFGYIMFEDLQNKRYARIWDGNVKDTEVR
eukprot:15753639-Heterocapsa_arctica.AAC.1